MLIILASNLFVIRVMVLGGGDFGRVMRVKPSSKGLVLIKKKSSREGSFHSEDIAKRET